MFSAINRCERVDAPPFLRAVLRGTAPFLLIHIYIYYIIYIEYLYVHEFTVSLFVLIIIAWVGEKIKIVLY